MADQTPRGRGRNPTLTFATLDDAIKGINRAAVELQTAMEALTRGLPTSRRKGDTVAVRRKGRIRYPSWADRDPEVRAHVDKRLDAGAYQSEIRAECLERFGSKRTPSRSTLSTYAKRRREIEEAK